MCTSVCRLHFNNPAELSISIQYDELSVKLAMKISLAPSFFQATMSQKRWSFQKKKIDHPHLILYSLFKALPQGQALRCVTKLLSFISFWKITKFRMKKYTFFCVSSVDLWTIEKITNIKFLHYRMGMDLKNDLVFGKTNVHINVI